LVDLLPAFIKQRDVEGDLLYMPSDVHWSNRGVRLAAKLLADRGRQCPWYDALEAEPGSYTTKPVAFTRRGDICEMLTDAEQLKYPPMKLEAEQVVAPDGSLYEDDPDSPIVMLGDSFTGVFHFEDCEHAGLSAHLAKELGVPIDLIMAQGSGPKIRGQLARRGAAAFDQRSWSGPASPATCTITGRPGISSAPE
jgi:alginate O-acetyltransferase complex protein AlgJ